MLWRWLLQHPINIDINNLLELENKFEREVSSISLDPRSHVLYMYIERVTPGRTSSLCTPTMLPIIIAVILTIFLSYMRCALNVVVFFFAVSNVCSNDESTVIQAQAVVVQVLSGLRFRGFFRPGVMWWWSLDVGDVASTHTVLRDRHRKVTSWRLSYSFCKHLLGNESALALRLAYNFWSCAHTDLSVKATFSVRPCSHARGRHRAKCTSRATNEHSVQLWRKMTSYVDTTCCDSSKSRALVYDRIEL